MDEQTEAFLGGMVFVLGVIVTCLLLYWFDQSVDWDKARNRAVCSEVRK